MQLRPWQRHSLVLAVAGFVYVLFGSVYLAVPLTEDRASALRLAILYVPIEVWGVAWILVGGLALASTRWPPQSKTWGYTALSTLSMMWALLYAGGIPLGAPLSVLTGTLVWTLVAFLWWAIAGLVNPDDVHETPPNRVG